MVHRIDSASACWCWCVCVWNTSKPMQFNWESSNNRATNGESFTSDIQHQSCDIINHPLWSRGLIVSPTRLASVFQNQGNATENPKKHKWWNFEIAWFLSPDLIVDCREEKWEGRKREESFTKDQVDKHRIFSSKHLDFGHNCLRYVSMCLIHRYGKSEYKAFDNGLERATKVDD